MGGNQTLDDLSGGEILPRTSAISTCRPLTQNVGSRGAMPLSSTPSAVAPSASTKSAAPITWKPAHRVY